MNKPGDWKIYLYFRLQTVILAYRIQRTVMGVVYKEIDGGVYDDPNANIKEVFSGIAEKILLIMAQEEISVKIME